jgi:hypothetical protein
MYNPDPPVNVRVVLKSGAELPVDTLYHGMRHRLHEWVVVNGPPIDEVFGMRIQALPPRTRVLMEEERSL